MRQCLVCGQQVPPDALSCSLCGTVMPLLLKSSPLLTGAKWADELLGAIIGVGLLFATMFPVIIMMGFAGPASGLPFLAVSGLIYFAVYFFIRRSHAFVAQGMAMLAIIVGALILGLFMTR